MRLILKLFRWSFGFSFKPTATSESDFRFDSSLFDDPDQAAAAFNWNSLHPDDHDQVVQMLLASISNPSTPPAQKHAANQILLKRLRPAPGVATAAEPEDIERKLKAIADDTNAPIAERRNALQKLIDRQKK